MAQSGAAPKRTPEDSYVLNRLRIVFHRLFSASCGTVQGLGHGQTPRYT